MMSKPVGSTPSCPLPQLLPLSSRPPFSDGLQMWKCKPFLLHLLLGMVFHHSNNNPNFDTYILCLVVPSLSFLLILEYLLEFILYTDIKFFNFMCMTVLSACMSMHHIAATPLEARIRCQISWNCSERWL